MQTRRRVLVIDDEEPALEMIRIILTRNRYDVTLADSGDDGIAQLLYHRFDLVLCDIAMPGKNGLDTLKSLKALDPTIPVIMMASCESDRLAFESTEPDYFRASPCGGRLVQKPIVGSELIAIIYRCLAHRSAQIH